MATHGAGSCSTRTASAPSPNPATPHPPTSPTTAPGTTASWPAVSSAGLNALLLARIRAGRQGTVVHLARPSGRVTRLLELTGADQVFAVDSDVPWPRPAR
ncbi:STAS domain-containing protein [Kitasatospora sp. NPDC085464]|uniref:STAS domain-containing protein n=1 Tax=Kitasatospora sp. NPDC085464 TaxID=3364063 RepID=UPI0037CA9F5D